MCENLNRAKSHAVIDGGGRSIPSQIPMTKAKEPMHRRRQRGDRRGDDHGTAIIMVVVMVSAEAEDILLALWNYELS